MIHQQEVLDHSSPEIIGAEQEVGHLGENKQLPFRRRALAMLRFQQTKALKTLGVSSRQRPQPRLA